MSKITAEQILALYYQIQQDSDNGILDVDAANAALADLYSKLEDEASHIFHGNVVINTPAGLEFYLESLPCNTHVDGYVDIDVTADMDITKVQDVINKISSSRGSSYHNGIEFTTTPGFAYTAGAGVDTEVTFNNLKVVDGDIDIDQEGGYQLDGLKTAHRIMFDDHSSVSRVSLESLEICTGLSNWNEDGIFSFVEASEINLRSLIRSPRTALTLGVATGGIIDISSLKDVDVSGRDIKLNLTIFGAASFTSGSNISGNKAGSSIRIYDVADVNLEGYNGTIITT